MLNTINAYWSQETGITAVNAFPGVGIALQTFAIRVALLSTLRAVSPFLAR